MTAATTALAAKIAGSRTPRLVSGPDAKRRDAVSGLVKGDDPAADGRLVAGELRRPRLIVSGSSAEQPSPARQKAATVATGAFLGRTAISTKAPASRNGRQ